MKLKKIALGLLLILILLLITFVLLSPKPIPHPSARLPDGTIVTLEAVTYGKSQTFTYGKPYQKTLYRMLPTKLRRLCGVRIVTYSTGNINDPVFWLVFNSDKPFQSSTVTVMDEYGAELNPTGPNISSYMQRRSGMSPVRIAPYSIGSQAPHGKIVGICFYSDSSKTKRIAQLMIPGESLATMPATDSTLPVVKSVEELSIELTSLVTGLKAVPHNQSRATNEFFTQARFRVKNKSNTERKLSVESIKVVGTGGTATKVTNFNSFIGDDLIVNFDSHLDPKMPCNFEIQLATSSDSTDLAFALDSDLRFNFNRDLCFAFQAVPTYFQSTNLPTSK